jgi:hypothetical protein
MTTIHVTSTGNQYSELKVKNPLQSLHMPTYISNGGAHHGVVLALCRTLLFSGNFEIFMTPDERRDKSKRSASIFCTAHYL